MDIKNLSRNTFIRVPEHLQKGQRITYEGDEAEVISVTPFLVIRTKNGIICGDLHKKIEYRGGDK